MRIKGVKIKGVKIRGLSSTASGDCYHALPSPLSSLPLSLPPLFSLPSPLSSLPLSLPPSSALPHLSLTSHSPLTHAYNHVTCL